MQFNVGLLVAVVLTAVVWNMAEGYVARAHVKAVNGHCLYENKKLKHKQSIQLETPCEAWFCDAETHTVSIGACEAFSVPENCKNVTGKGAYPDCCPRVVCGANKRHT